MSSRLYRSRRDRMLAGVAGGLAEMWGADPSVVRILWAVLVLITGGVALILYVVMAIVVPEEDELYGPTGSPAAAVPVAPDAEAMAARRATRVDRGGTPVGVVVGGLLVLIGLFFLVREYFPRVDLDWFWPVVLVVAGVLVIASAVGGRSRSAEPPPSSPPPQDGGGPTPT